MSYQIANMPYPLTATTHNTSHFADGAALRLALILYVWANGKLAFSVLGNVEWIFGLELEGALAHLRKAGYLIAEAEEYTIPDALYKAWYKLDNELEPRSWLATAAKTFWAYLMSFLEPSLIFFDQLQPMHVALCQKIAFAEKIYGPGESPAMSLRAPLFLVPTLESLQGGCILVKEGRFWRLNDAVVKKLAELQDKLS